MKNTKIKILLVVLALSFTYLNGCESNDNPQNPIFNPPSVGKKVLFEFFTNSGCIPCIPAHAYLDQINSLGGVTTNDTNIIILSFHTTNPYNQDSLYRANVTQNNARISYYEIFFNPQGRINGAESGQFSTSEWTAKFNSELSQPVSLSIGIDKTFDPVADTGTISAYLLPLSALAATDNVLHVIISESNIQYITAPNGIKEFDDVMRYMVTGSDGQAVTLAQGQTTTVNVPFTIENTWNPDECYITIFVQSVSTKQVYGVERIKVK
ncbi:MAG: hypothetical protein EHM58_15425 [Ignavibacteriae bacterium]|nr:MAG: hypothetical protein EHM58_15425 [Ignavibacteriota bacterium]